MQVQISFHFFLSKAVNGLHQAFDLEIMGNNQSKGLLDEEWESIKSDDVKDCDIPSTSKAEAKAGATEDRPANTENAARPTVPSDGDYQSETITTVKATLVATIEDTGHPTGIPQSPGTSLPSCGLGGPSEVKVLPSKDHRDHETATHLKVSEPETSANSPGCGSSGTVYAAPPRCECRAHPSENHSIGKNGLLRGEVKTSCGRFPRCENQTFPNGILKGPNPVKQETQIVSQQKESEAAKPPNSKEISEKCTQTLPLHTESGGKPGPEEAEKAYLRKKALALQHEMVRKYSKNPDLNASFESWINRPDTKSTTIKKFILDVKATKLNVDRADEVVRKMGLKPSFSPSCRLWKDDAWSNWKSAMIRTLGADPRYVRIQQMVIDAVLFKPPQQRGIADWARKSLDFVVLALWETKDSCESIAHKIRQLQAKH